MQEGEVAAVFIILQDVTEYIEQEKALRQTSHGLETFTRAMNSKQQTFPLQMLMAE